MISNIPKNTNVAPFLQPSQVQSGVAEKTSSAQTAASDRVSLSTREIVKSSAGSIQEPFNSELVSRLKSEIKNGTYKVSAERIADKMLNETLISRARK